MEKIFDGAIRENDCGLGCLSRQKFSPSHFYTLQTVHYELCEVRPKDNDGDNDSCTAADECGCRSDVFGGFHQIVVRGVVLFLGVTFEGIGKAFEGSIDEFGRDVHAGGEEEDHPFQALDIEQECEEKDDAANE